MSGVYSTNENDGIFWMSLEEIYIAFNQLEISIYDPTWQYSYYSRENDDGKTKNYRFKLNNTVGEIHAFMINFYNKRNYGKGCLLHERSYAIVKLFKNNI